MARTGLFFFRSSGRVSFYADGNDKDHERMRVCMYECFAKSGLRDHREVVTYEVDNDSKYKRNRDEDID
jgi:hypothetical protein